MLLLRYDDCLLYLEVTYFANIYKRLSLFLHFDRLLGSLNRYKLFKALLQELSHIRLGMQLVNRLQGLLIRVLIRTQSVDI